MMWPCFMNMGSGQRSRKANEYPMSGFTRKRNGEVLATFSHYEGAILKSLAEQLLELLGEGDSQIGRAHV